MLKTKNVFLDTETFVANGYFSNHKLNNLAEYGDKGIVNIYITQITKEEVKSNIREDLVTTIHQINQFKKEIHKKGRILRNLDGFKDYLELPKLDNKLDFDKVVNSLDEFIQLGKVTIIPYGTIDIEPIFKKYFNKEKPFGEGKKKYEFPDAIILKTIEDWCEAKKKQTYIISSDPDILEHKSDNIIPIKTVGKFLGLINRQEILEEAKFDWIERIFIDNQEKMSALISEHFTEKLKDEYYSEIKVYDVSFYDITFFDFSIVEESKGYFILQMDVDISYNLELSYMDYSNSKFDTEDDHWLHQEIKHERIDFDDTITVEFEIEAEFDERNEPDQDISINCIYTGIPNEDKIESRIMDYSLRY